MRRIATIVEGHGEVEAVPLLLRRIAQGISPGLVVDVPRPIRVKRQQFLKDAAPSFDKMWRDVGSLLGLPRQR